MSPRPNPTQTKGADALAWERERQQWLRPGYVFTEELFAVILRDLSGSHLARIAVRAWIDERRDELHGRYVLTPEQADQLERFLEDKGPRPSFVPPAREGGYLTSEERAVFAAAAADRIAREPKELPGEPGRFIEASGPFARSDAPGFHPAPR